MKAIPYPPATARPVPGTFARAAFPTPLARPVAAPPPVYRPNNALPVQRAAVRALPPAPPVYRPANRTPVQARPAAARQFPPPPPVYRPAAPAVRPATSIQPLGARSAPSIAAPAPVAFRPQPQTAQMRHAAGFYVTNTNANLRRRSNQNYTVKQQLNRGVLVHTRPNPDASNFKAGTHWYSPTNEHTWVEVVDATLEENADLLAEWPIRGWVKDSNLTAAPNILQTNFQAGDKLYGRHEARDTIRQSGEAYNAGVRAADYNIIDDINNRIMGGEDVSGDAEAHAFHQFARPLIPGGQTRRARQWCKRALAHYTIGGHTIHFMLDGMDPGNFTDDIGGHDSCTNSELRSLMRQRLHDIGNAHGKNYGVDLGQVRFYQNYQQVPAPWERGADPDWRQAWLNYQNYREH